VSYFDSIAGAENDYTKWWGAKVQVHGDSNLRDLILSWLSSEPDGYAVNVPGVGGLDIRTVSPTRRAAIVNWLHLNGVTITHHHTDDAIESIWRSFRHLNDGRKAYCIKVHVFAAQHGADVSEQPRD
jgi:hypothetical protein